MLPLLSLPMRPLLLLRPLLPLLLLLLLLWRGGGRGRPRRGWQRCHM